MSVVKPFIEQREPSALQNVGVGCPWLPEPPADLGMRITHCVLLQWASCLDQQPRLTFQRSPARVLGTKALEGATPSQRTIIASTGAGYLDCARLDVHAIIKLYPELPHNDVQRAKLESRAAEGVPGDSRWRAGGSIY